MRRHEPTQDVNSEAVTKMPNSTPSQPGLKCRPWVTAAAT